MILLKTLSSMPTTRARKFCRTELLKSCNFRFGYIALPQTAPCRGACRARLRNQREPFSRLALAPVMSITLLADVVVLHIHIRGVEYYAKKFLPIECARRFLERFPLAVMCSHHHDKAVAGRTDQLEIRKGQNGRCINENDFEHLAALAEKFRPARPGEEFRRRRRDGASRQNEQISLIGRHDGFVGGHVAGENFCEPRRARMVEHGSETAGPHITINHQDSLLRKLRIAQSKVHGGEGFAFAG